MSAQPEDHFDTPSTSWTLIEQAHNPDTPLNLRQAAQHQLILRYERLVRRYLAGALSGVREFADAIDECVQEFSKRVLEGRYRHAAPERGRFRGYLFRSLQNLVTDYHRSRAGRPESLGDHDPAAPTREVSDQEFTRVWSEELVCRALQALADHEQRTGQVLYTILKFKLDHPEMSAVQIAASLSGPEETRTTEWVSTRLYRAREKLTELIRREVSLSLQTPTDEAIEEELADLGLLAYLEKRKRFTDKK
jgi:RNA polymerase sigma-70 factor (ECF subfamily)